VEALYASDPSPLITLMSQEGVRAMAGALPVVAEAPDSMEARGRALYGAWLCGSCPGATTMGLHHKLCHVLGGTFGRPHTETHTVVLPYALAYNAPAVPEVASAWPKPSVRTTPRVACGGRPATSAPPAPSPNWA
jgi:maleylacetate reductase